VPRREAASRSNCTCQWQTYIAAPINVVLPLENTLRRLGSPFYLVASCARCTGFCQILRRIYRVGSQQRRGHLNPDAPLQRFPFNMAHKVPGSILMWDPGRWTHHGAADLAQDMLETPQAFPRGGI